jgi:type III pantothenate kinase
MSVNLCIDWGNTNVKVAVFHNDKIAQLYQFPEAITVKNVQEIIDAHRPVKAIMCAVVYTPGDMLALLKEKFKSSFINLDGYTRVPVSNAYGSTDTLGADRLALVSAAYTDYPEKNNLVISLGTCITYNLVQNNKTFRGGAISPGMQMRLKAMNHFTDKLPFVSAEGELTLVGYDTPTCMRSGAIYGMAAEIDGMIKNYADKYPDFNAILTGGDAPFFADKLKNKIFADPDLLLRGLNIIINYNVPFPR